MSKITLMAGTQKGAFLMTSDEGRKNWKLSEPLFKGWSVFDMVRDERNGATLHAAVNHFIYGPGIHISRDSGQTWRQVEHSPQYGEKSPHKLNNIWCVVPGRPSEPDTLYAGVDEAGLFVTRDGGQHWEEVSGLSNHPTRSEWVPGNGGLCCHSIVLDPDNEKRMWVGISAVGVFCTQDGGASWEVANDGLEIIIESETHKCIGSCVHSLIGDPRNPDRLFQQNHRGVYRSLDGAKSWQRIEQGIPNIFGFPMAMSPRDSNTLFIVPQESEEFRFAPGGQPGVSRTTNGGDSWQVLRDGLPEQAFIGVLRQAMATDTCDETGVYFGTTTGQIFHSRDTGEHWEALPFLLPRIQSLSVVMDED